MKKISITKISIETHSEHKDAPQIYNSMVSGEKELEIVEDLIYECNILLAQAQCFDFLDEMEINEGRISREMMTDEKRYENGFIS